MALNTSTISGYLTKPDGTALVEGAAVFTLSGPASSSEYITNTVEVIAPTNSEGYFSVELMPNSAYPYFTYYNLVGYDFLGEFGKKGNGYQFGKVLVPNSNANIADLLPVVRSTVNTYYLHHGDSLNAAVTMLDYFDRPVDITDTSVTAYLEYLGEQISISSFKSSSETGLIEINISPAVSSSLKYVEYTLVVRLQISSAVKTLRSKVKVI